MINEFFQQSFINLVFIGLISLFPVINPIGSAFILSPFFENLQRREKRKAVNKIVFYAFCICIVSLFLGQAILRLFGISIPVVQLAGGILICKMGWEFLSSSPKSSADHRDVVSDEMDPVSAYAHISDKLFYPITFPATTGAGTISVIFTLSAHANRFGSKEYIMNVGAILVSIVIMCCLIYIFYLNTRTIIRFLGPHGETIVNRISAFLIFCVGLQIGFSGLKTILNM